MSEHYDGLETRDPGAREAALMAALPARVAAFQATAAGAVVLAGVALMLWSGRVWVWVLVPAVPLVLAFGLLWWGHDRTAPDSTLAELGRQLALDAEWLRHAGRP